MKCTRGRESRYLVCLHVFRPSRVISSVHAPESYSYFGVSRYSYSIEWQTDQHRSATVLNVVAELGPSDFTRPLFPKIRI
ncbi:hypothetical protein Enr13x_67620 [Stieleria neptunia]|uniref:Uncharacterized protein n=1 Tax=Stieleria neptunia TaxID=2527979 RepID=A0A518I176_9BACT|nr:hypothetical protein Enr13x_67620 [Stieleria neptunia]